MKYLNILVSTLNQLRAKGLTQHAASLDRFLQKHAVELGDLGLEDLETEPTEPAAAEPTELAAPAEPAPTPAPAGPPVADEKSNLQRTLFYKFQKWHGVLDKELPKFEYLGENNIDALRSALAGVHKAFEQTMKSVSAKFNKEMIDKWNKEVEKIVHQLKQSQKAPVEGTKAVVDTHLLYDTTNQLYEEFVRLCGDDDKFGVVGQEFSNLMHAFTNVIKNNSEEVAKKDLTEAR